MWQADAFRACAPSKLNDPNDPPTPVPTIPLTLTTICAVPPRYDAAPHRSVVAVVHDALRHATPSSSDVVGVRSFELKLSPEIVTDAPPDCAMLDGLVPVTTGAAQTRYVTVRAAGGCVAGVHRRS